MLGGLPTLGLPSKLQAPAHLVDQPPCSNRKGASLVKVVSFLSYFFAGVFLTNSIPHLVIAVTGRRNRTAFGENSSPVVNLLWSGINVAGGSLLVRFADRREHVNTADSKAWQVPYEAGCLALSVFGVLYAWFTASQELRKVPTTSALPTRDS